MFRKLLLTAAALAAVSAAATAQPGRLPPVKSPTPKSDGGDPPQWKLGVAMVAATGGGVVLNQVFDNSPAKEIGLEAGDVLLTVNGKLAADPLAVRDTVFASDQLTLVLKRGDQYYQTDVTFTPPDNGGGGGPEVVTSAFPGGGVKAAPKAVAKTIKKVETKAIPKPR